MIRFGTSQIMNFRMGGLNLTTTPWDLTSTGPVYRCFLIVWLVSISPAAWFPHRPAQQAVGANLHFGNRASPDGS